MREVEVKYRLVDPARAEELLAGWGIRFGSPVEQDDQAYAPLGWEYGQSKLGVPFARLRTECGRHLFTVKTPLGNAQSCVELRAPCLMGSDRLHRRRTLTTSISKPAFAVGGAAEPLLHP